MAKPKYNEVAVFQYRCRRCRELFDSHIETTAANADFTLIRSMHPIPEMDIGSTAPLLTTHTEHCIAGGVSGVGVADLAGYRIRTAL